MKERIYKLSLVLLSVALGLILLIGMFGFLAVLVPVARAATLTVNTLSDENDHSCSDGDCSLRDAMETAIEGDTIEFDLTYPTTITLKSELQINKSMTINGPGINQLAISGNNTNRIFFISISNSSPVTITNVTIRDGRATNANGGGIYNERASLFLRDIVIIKNSAYLGGGIYIDSGNVLMTEGQIIGNSATFGGGVYVYDGNVTLNEGQIASNSSRTGGGVYISSGSVFLNGGKISSNSVFFDGGGIWVGYGSATLTEVQIFSNSAESGGGIGLISGNAILNRVQVFSNSASLRGGGMYISSDGFSPGNVKLDGGQITNNSVDDDGDGGGAISTFQGDLTLNRVKVAKNSAPRGGGIWISGSTNATLTEGQIINNFAQSGGGIRIDYGST